MTAEQRTFIETVGKLVQNDRYADKILPSLTIAQAILESGWGNSGLTVKANALFGIKAGKGWNGKVYSCKTQECYDGVNFTNETACFRAYGSWAESIADHGAFLCGLPRYRKVIGERDYKAACRAIHEAGYATDPTYADKLIRMIEQYDLTAYDPRGIIHEVSPGETLNKISAMYCVTVEKLLEANAGKYPSMTADYIQAGWNLSIPAQTYTVRAGDTLPDIARSQGMTLEEIVTKNPNLIRTGDVLLV